MAEARHACPKCQYVDLEITQKGLLGASGESLSAAKCPACGWEGPLADSLGVIFNKPVWTIERVGDFLIQVMSKHAAGPMVQAMEHVGLLYPLVKNVNTAAAKKHNELVEEGRDRILKAILEASITAAFEEAAKVHEKHAQEMGIDMIPLMQEQPTSEPEEIEESFGGDAS